MTIAPAGTRTRCLACGGRKPSMVLSLGSMPLANAFVNPVEAADPEARYPLELLFCPDCALVQLSELVDPAILFDDYVYMTGTSSTMRRHYAELADAHVARFGLGDESLVVDVGSNDGSLLSAFAKKGVRTLGIEPASNLSRIARHAGIEIVDGFFDSACALLVVADYGAADLVCVNNVLPHATDLSDILKGCRLLLGDKGVLSVEVQWLLPCVEHLEYDTIYHEHFSYFTLIALRTAFERAGLGIFDVQQLPVHGGTLRVLARPGHAVAPVVDEICARERARGLDRADTFREFAGRVAKNRTDLRALLESLKKQGRRIAAYGAPAKGNTLLNWCGLGPDLVEYAVDRNPLKVGRLTPGMRIPVVPRERLDTDPPDYLLILPWNLTDEIVQQEAAFRKKGGRFVIPIPEPRILE